MTARIKTVAFEGVDVREVDAQVGMTGGLVAFMLVGLPDKAVGESRERVRGALAAIGLALPSKRIICNLAPADLAKEGSHFDLPIALGLLVTMGVLPADSLHNYTALGELGLDGSIAPVAGVLPAAIHAASQNRGLICPAAQGGEAAWAGQIEVLAPPTLLALINHIKGSQVLTPPGSGKSMLAARLPGILPPLAPVEALEVSMVHSLAGQLAGGRLLRTRPFRDPHHSASLPALVGGGLRVRPGEVSLAHLGVLFLDELPEFQRPTLESLRQPLETGRIRVARANAHVTYPARFQLIAAMNPCKCGYLGDPQQGCSRQPRCAEDYQSRISGPLFDRIDLHVEVPAVSPSDLSLPPPAEGSAEVAVRVAAARARQTERFAAVNATVAGNGHGAVIEAGLAGKIIRTNAEADGELLEQVAAPDAEGRRLLTEAAERFKLSARGYHRVLRVARTLADLDGAASVRRQHVAEALSYRRIQLRG